MEDDKVAVEKAIKSWRYLIAKIDQFRNTLSNQENFEKLTLAELRTKLNRMQSLQNNLIDKDMLVNTLSTDSGTADEHDECMNLCEALESKIHCRIAEIQKAEKQKSGIAPKRVNEAAKASTENHGDIEVQDAKSRRIDNTWGNFGGSVFDWSKFAKEFAEKVHSNKELVEAEKLELLKKSCFESARDLVECAGANYEMAWRQLNEMFGDAYMTIHRAMHKIQALPVMEKSRYEEVKFLQTNGEKCMATLNETPVAEQFSPFLVIMLASKLNDDTARAWDRHRAGLAESWAANPAEGEERAKAAHIPNWPDFQEFLKSECNALIKQGMRNTFMSVANEPSRVSVADKAGTSGERNVQQENLSLRHNKPTAQEKRMAHIDLQCILCDQIHMPFNCEVFKAMSYEERWDHVHKNGLCVRCLRKYHGSASCINKANNEKCARCQKFYNKVAYHNSALCSVNLGRMEMQPPAREPTPDWNDECK